MIYKERLIIRNKEYIRTYSDLYTIEREGVEYDEAIDLPQYNREYTETENLKYIEEVEE